MSSVFVAFDDTHHGLILGVFRNRKDAFDACEAEYAGYPIAKRRVPRWMPWEKGAFRSSELCYMSKGRPVPTGLTVEKWRIRG